MNRAFSLVCLALLMVGFGATTAFAKPMIAVLGLEVVDPSGTPSALDTQVAKELTDGLRARAKAGTGQFALAPGSDKELIDQKLLNNCDNEAPACMSAIGGQLNADTLMFGKLQKQGNGSYQVTLKVLDVGKKNLVKSSTDLIPASEAQGAALQGWAKKIYAKLTGEQSGGTIVVKLTNADRGTILLDGAEKGNITNGTGQVGGLAEGKYKLAVESDGFRRWDRDVTVTAGQTSTIPVELERGSGGTVGGGLVGTGPGPGAGSDPEGSSGSGLWKGVFIGSLVAAGAGGGWLYLNYQTIQDSEETVRLNTGYDTAPNTPAQNAAIADANDKGDRAEKMTWVGGAVMGVGLGVAVFAFYKGFIESRDTSKESSTATRGKRQRRGRFIVTPVVSPDGGGATVRLDW